MKIFLTIFLLLLTTLLLPLSALPSKVYFEVPFICQAPYGNWNQPWQDACEEVVIIMAIHYISKKPLTTEIAHREILDLVDFQIKKYGGHDDLSAEKIAKLIKDYYQYDKVEVRYDIGIKDIKQELAKGNVVIAPMAGRLLGNPYYTPPGPVYHNLLFKGYDNGTGEFITNDAGTRRGRNYRYKYNVAYNAIYDWTGSKRTITKGKKAMVVVFKVIPFSTFP